MLEFSASFAFLGKAMSMIMDEVSRGVERENSKKRYISTARTVLRLLWFFDFLVHLLENLAEHLDWKMS